MEEISIVKYLADKKYPGRTICFSVDNEKNYASIIYFIMGRSENSQNRIFIRKGNQVYTKAFDESKVTDPSLIIYPVFKEINGHFILTNGDQTQTIFEGFEKGLDPVNSLRTRDFEPDKPNFTPRISLVSGKDNYQLSILKANSFDAEASCRYFFEYPYMAGVGHCIHTYVDDGNPLPSFYGEPVRFSYEENLREKIWQTINPDYKISLVEIKIDIENNKLDDIVIINGHEE